MATPTLDALAPPSLRRLHALFSSLEFSLSSLALYQHTADWEAVKRAVESSSQTTLSKDDLRSILWLVPTAYVLTWSQRSLTRKHSRADDDKADETPILLLRRQRMTDENDETETLTQRIACFTNRLNEWIHESITRVTTDTPTIPEHEITTALGRLTLGQVELPEPNKTTTIHEHNHERIQALGVQRAHNVPSKELATALAAPVPTDLQTLPQWLIDKVRRQEQQSKTAKQRTDAAQRHRLYTTLPQLSDQIQSLTLVQRKRVFPLPNMIKQLKTKAPIRDQIEEQIHLLESMVPFWLTVFFSDGQTYVKLSGGYKYNEVKTALRKALATMAPSL